MKKQNSCKLYVSGMHCPSCELLLQKKISKFEGISDTKASLTDSSVEVTYRNGFRPNIDILNDHFLDDGYTFSEKPIGEVSFEKSSLLQILAFAIVGIVIFIILEDSKILSRFTLDATSTLPAFFVLGVVASLSSCAILVGGVLLSMSTQWNRLYGGKDQNKRILPFALFNIGRLISFALLGGVLGLIGSFFKISFQFTSVLVLMVSVVMVLLGLQMLGVSWAKKIRFGFPRFISSYAVDEQNFKGKYMPFMIGAMTFFIPCGFTLMAQTVALTTGSFWISSAMMFIFALGTLPMLGALSFSSVKFQTNSAISGSFNLLVGLFIIIFGAYNVNAQLNVLGVASFSDFASSFSRVSNTSNEGVSLVGEGKEQYQAVTLKAKGFEYTPKQITLKAGILTKLNVESENVIGCAQSMRLGGLDDKILTLNVPNAKTEFIPKKGIYKITCTMGMVPPVIVTVN